MYVLPAFTFFVIIHLTNIYLWPLSNTSLAIQLSISSPFASVTLLLLYNTTPVLVVHISRFIISAEYTESLHSHQPSFKVIISQTVYENTNRTFELSSKSFYFSPGRHICIIQVKFLYLSLVRYLPHSDLLSYHFKNPLPLLRQASATAGIISVFIKSADTSAGVIFTSKSKAVFHYFQHLQ